MKIALTGATGHLGAAVVRELVTRGISPRVLLRGDDNGSCAGLPVEIIRGSILDHESLDLLLDGCTAVIHCAGVISVNGDPGGIVQRTNVEGTRHMLEAARRQGILRAIYIGTVHAYDQFPYDQLLDEERPMITTSGTSYDVSKRDGQELALSMNDPFLEVVAICPTGLIGPFDFKPSRMGQMLIDVATGRWRIVANGGFDFCDTRDAARAIVNALSMGQPGNAYLLSGRWISLSEIANLVLQFSKRHNKIYVVPKRIAQAGIPFAKLIAAMSGKEPVYTSEALRAVYTGNRHISSRKAQRDLEYTSRPLEVTVEDTLRWFREMKYLS